MLYPVVSRNLNLFSSLSADSKRFDDKLFGFTIKKASNDAQFPLSGDARDALLGAA